MSEQMITNEDMQYLIEESNSNLNMILAGMTLLMEENYEKVSMLENQTWFKRMTKTISGNNKMTQNEIERNHDKINLYVSQAMGELFNRNCIDHELILGLGNKINELYESQVEIKQMIGAFALKLNQKIESIDNFHMLITEISQGVYSNMSPFLAISQIMSQLDLRTVKDSRKMDILVREMEEREIIKSEEVRFVNVLTDLLGLNESTAGILVLFYGNIRDEYIAKIIEEAMYEYYLLPEKIRRMKNKQSIVESVLIRNDIDVEFSISSKEIYYTLIEACADNIVAIAQEEQMKEKEEKKTSIIEYIETSKKFLALLDDMVEMWEANSGELNIHSSRVEYAEFMNGVIENLDQNSYIGKSIIDNLNNITFFAQNLFSKYEDLRIIRICSERLAAFARELFGAYNEEDVCINVSNKLALEIEEGKYFTVTEYFNKFINDLFNNPENFRTKQKYSIEHLDNICNVFPMYSSYTDYSILYGEMKTYVNLFNQLFEKIEKKLDEDEELLIQVYNLIEKYSVQYTSDYENVFLRENDLSKPHIEIEYPSLFGQFKRTSVGYASIAGLEDYSTTTIVLRFKNIQLESYTVNMEIIENNYIDMDDFESYEYVDVEWGEWVEDNSLELKIIKNNEDKFGTIKIKIFIEECPDIIACICG